MDYIEEITEYLSIFTDYLENYTKESKKLDNAISRLKEAIFWLTYYQED